jgi:hypothetical protein
LLAVKERKEGGRGVGEEHSCWEDKEEKAWSRRKARRGEGRFTHAA